MTPSPPCVTVSSMTALGNKGSGRCVVSGGAQIGWISNDATDDYCTQSCDASIDCVAAETRPGGSGQQQCHLWRGAATSVTSTSQQGTTCWKKERSMRPLAVPLCGPVAWRVGGMRKRGGGGHLGLTHTETQRGRLQTACGQRRVDSKNSQTTAVTTSTSSIRQLLGAADAQTAHYVTSSTAPTHQPLGSANAETTPARAPAAAADRTQRPDATCEGKNG